MKLTTIEIAGNAGSGWNLQLGEEKRFSHGISCALEDFLSHTWVRAVKETVHHPWWGIASRGIPSPIVRVDLAPTEEGCLPVKNIYEVEIRPGGLGIAATVFQEKIDAWRMIMAGCNGFIKTQGSPIHDDVFCADVLGIPYFDDVPNDRKLVPPYWVRSEGFERAEELESISLVPIRDDGDKHYLVRLGLAKVLKKDVLDWSSSFVIKPAHGKWCRNVEIYVASDKHFKKFSSTQARIRRVLEKDHGADFLIQEFIPPKVEMIREKVGHTIWRVFYGWNGQRYTYIGGFWMWRPSLKVHGASDAVWGALRIPE